MKKYLFFLFFLICIIGLSSRYYAPQNLNTKQKKAPLNCTLQDCDTNIINKIIQHACAISGYNLDSSIIYCMNALECSQSLLNDTNARIKLCAETRVADIYNLLGTYYYYKNDTLKAIENLNKAYDGYAELSNYRSMAYTAGFTGYVLMKMKKYLLALNSFSVSTDIFQHETNDEIGEAWSYENWATYFSLMKDNDHALDYNIYSQKIWEQIDDSINNARSLANIGLNYKNKGDYTSSLTNYFKSLKIREILNNKQDLVWTYEGIASAYYLKKDYDSSLYYYFKTLKIRENIISSSHNPVDSSSAIEKLKTAIDLAKTDPNDVNYINLSLEYYYNAKYTECILASQKALDFNSKSYAAYNNMCSAYNQIGKWNEAITAGKKALEIIPGDQLATNNLNISFVGKSKENESNYFGPKFSNQDDLFTIIKNKQCLAKCYESIAGVYYKKKDSSGVFRYCGKAQKIYEESLDSLQLAWIYGELGRYYSNFENYDRSTLYFQKAMILNSELKDKSFLAWDYIGIAINYSNTGNYANACKYILEASKIYEVLGDTLNLLESYKKSANYNDVLMNYTISLAYHSKILAIYEKQHNGLKIVETYLAMTALAVRQKRIDSTDYKNMYKYLVLSNEYMNNAFNVAKKNHVVFSHETIKSYSKYIGINWEPIMYLLQENAESDSLSKIKSKTITNLNNTTKELKIKNDSIESEKELMAQKVLLAAKDLELQKQININQKSEIERKKNDSLLFSKTNQIKSDSLKNLKLNKEINEQTILKQKAQNSLNIILFIVVGVILVMVSLLGFVILRNKKKREKEAFDRKVDQMNNKVQRLKVDPHFIGNTIEFVNNNYVQCNDSTNASIYLNKLQELMRLMLENPDKKEDKKYDVDENTLKQEMSILEFYIDLMNLISEHKVNYKIEYDKEIDIEEIKVPSALIQPLIENAFKHAFSGIETPELKIKFTFKNELLYCTITDNGRGIEGQQEIFHNTKKKYESFGNKNTEDRINILSKISKRKGLFKIEQLKDNNQNHIGTRVEIAFPVSFAY